jgi:ATP-binding cassette, subfamily F, member 3
MIQILNVCKHYGSKVLFEGASAFIGDRARVALVGPNGAGKSTLVRLILGQETPDSGQMIRSQNLELGHLAQELPKLEGGTVFSTVMKLGNRIEALKDRRVHLEESFSKGLDDPKVLEEYGKILTELERFDESHLEARAKEILMGMGFKTSDFSRNLSEFSGGWIMRVVFSRILLLEPDLLLLDEPTNHLDLESLLWLENFLKNYPGAILIISHDSAFLNNLVEEVIEIDQKKIFQYRGNLTAQEEQKRARLEYLQAQYRNQQAKIEHLEEFIAKNRAKASKATQAQSRIKQLEKMEKIELPEERASIRFRFPPIPPGGKEVITLKDVKVQFGEKRVFERLNWTLQRGARVAITGVNGAGKTTLLRILSGQLEPSSGEVKLGHHIQIGYYAQHQSETLNLERTILEELVEIAPHLPISHIRSIAGAFLFTGDSVEKKCSILSGGEKARVALAKLLLVPSNFLILDEPTNHLDADSREVLLEALKEYPGTICLVTHDRDFAIPLVTSVLEIHAGIKPSEPSQAVQLLGSYEDYLQTKLKEIALQDLNRKTLAVREAQTPKNAQEQKRSQAKLEEKDRRLREKKIAQLEQEILTLEAKRDELDNLLTKKATSSHTDIAALAQQREKVQLALETIENEWIKLLESC